MPAKSSYTYTIAGQPRTFAQQLTLGQLGQLRKAAAKPKSKGDPIAVYDENGKLVGLVDPAKLINVGTAPGSSPAPVAAVPVAAVDPQTAAAAADIAKSLQRASWRLVPADAPVSFAKSAGTVAQRYDNLIGLLDARTRDSINAVVAMEAVRLSVSKGVPGPRAATLAKSIALDVAVAHRARI